MNRSINFVILLFSTLLINSAWASDRPSAASALAGQLLPMKSMTANFHQQIKDHRGDLLQQAWGVLKVKRPRRFYWLTQRPYEHLVVTDGRQLWLYDMDLEQITLQAFSADLDKAPALLLSGEIEQISKQYKVELTSLVDSASIERYKLTPKTAGSLFNVLTIQFDNARLSSMTLQDSFDQLTEIHFSDVQLNPVVDDQLFLFSPPKGVDVINNLNPDQP